MPGAASGCCSCTGPRAGGTDTFPEQLALADAFEVHLVDRRGYPDNAPAERVGFDVDADDLLDLLGESGAHLVGHSYGGVGCLLAAARAPERVTSLVVIEPAAYRLAQGDPAVDELVRRQQAMLHGRRHENARGAYRAYVESFGVSLPAELELSDRERRSLEPILAERPAWEAEIPLEPLRRLPVAVVHGTYGTDSAALRATARHAICGALVEAIGAESVVFEGGHNPQLEVGEAFNAWLREFLGATSSRRRASRAGQEQPHDVRQPTQ